MVGWTVYFMGYEYSWSAVYTYFVLFEMDWRTCDSLMLKFGDGLRRTPLRRRSSPERKFVPMIQI